MKMKSAIITNCTNRKRSFGGEIAEFRNVQLADVNDAAEQWLDILGKIKWLMPARDVYIGRSFAEMKKATRHLNADLFIASAGLGLIKDEAPIPNYSATITCGSKDSILKKIPGSRASEWWEQLNSESTFCTNVDFKLYDKIYIALTAPYLDMVMPNILSLIRSGHNGVRIFTKTTSICEVAIKYRMPFDDRLNDPNGPKPGTETDFPQRALSYFAEIVKDNTSNDIRLDFSIAESALSGYNAPKKPIRIQKNDAEICEIIRCEMNVVGSRSSKMLRHLRDDLNIACEQKRFQGLFKSVVNQA